MVKILLGLFLMWVAGWNAGIGFYVGKRDGFFYSAPMILLSFVIAVCVVTISVCECARVNPATSIAAAPEAE